MKVLTAYVEEDENGFNVELECGSKFMKKKIHKRGTMMVAVHLAVAEAIDGMAEEAVTQMIKDILAEGESE